MNCSYTVLDRLDEGSRMKEQFACDVREGLLAKQKHLPCKYIYDERGSELFCRIMELPEYYPTRCETEILNAHKHYLLEAIGRDPVNLVELGAGDGKKTRILLDHFTHERVDFSYVPVDISEDAVKDLSRLLGEKMPDLQVHGLVAEYFNGINWLSCNGTCRNLILFLGSNIGNFTPEERVIFLNSLRMSMKAGDYLLLGFDLKKDVDILHRAYNDSQGVTAEFNLNVLRRINRELGGGFDLGRFRFYSTWDPVAGAIQSFLLSTERQTVEISEIEMLFEFERWEPIHTESSHKFAAEGISSLAARTGFHVVRNFTDSKGFFVDSLWRVGL